MLSALRAEIASWNIRKRRKPKGKVQLKRQPAPPREARFVGTNGKEPELQEPIPWEFVV